jgi:hypothetical protein
VSNLDNLYRDFFAQNPKDLEAKNRCFKELYNILESSVFKFYDLFVESQANQIKCDKLQETFIQLDKVFGHEQSEDEDKQVLD